MAEVNGDEAAATSHFDLLCNMAEQLENEIGHWQEKRDSCQRCERPSNVCLCDYMPPSIQLKRNIKIWIFQHPKEEKRPLRTTRILEKCLSESNFEIIKSRRFNTDRYPRLAEVYNNENTYVLFPSPTAISLDEFQRLIDDKSNTDSISEESSTKSDPTFHVIIIDGTWSQASGIYYTNHQIQSLKQIKIEKNELTSAYSVRTQPRETFLSTLETVSVILSTIERDPTIHEKMVLPLKALCDFQMEHGAQPHQSKEYLIFNGLYKKPISRKNFNKLTQNSKFMNKECQGEKDVDEEERLHRLFLITNQKADKKFLPTE